MRASVWRRQNSAQPAAALLSRRSAGSTNTEAVLMKPRFHLDLWICLIVQNWILDVGRPVIMLLLPDDLCPPNRPGVAEYLHFLYNFSTPLLLLTMLERSRRTLPGPALHLGVISVVMGGSLRLVGESLRRRLMLIGHQPHLSVREDPIIKKTEPSSLIDAFQLLLYYEDTVGHLMWFVPLFLVLFLFFSGCFRKQGEKMQAAAWMLLVPNAAYYWYLISEGQTFILFIFTFFAMSATVMHQRRRGSAPDGNGLFMLYSFSSALVLVAVWVVCLWNDGALRRKHPGLIYIPQPGAVYSLYLQRNLQNQQNQHNQHT